MNAIEPSPAEATESKKQPSPSKKTEAKPAFDPRRLIAELTDTGDPEARVPERGAAMLVAHMLLVLGREKVESMAPGGARAYADGMRANHPMVWQSVDVADVNRFCYLLHMAGADHGTEEEYVQGIHALLKPAPKTAPKS